MMTTDGKLSEVGTTLYFMFVKTFLLSSAINFILPAWIIGGTQSLQVSAGVVVIASVLSNTPSNMKDRIAIRLVSVAIFVVAVSLFRFVL